MVCWLCCDEVLLIAALRSSSSTSLEAAKVTTTRAWRSDVARAVRVRVSNERGGPPGAVESIT